MRNFERLLTVRAFTLEPQRDESGNVVYDDDGHIAYPRLRTFTRKNPDYPELNGLREFASWQSGENRTVILAADVVFLRALINTLIFAAVIAPLQGGMALLLALILNQALRFINVFRAIYFAPVVVSMVVVSLLWRFIYDGNNGLLNTILGIVTFGHFPAGRLAGQSLHSHASHDRHVGVASGWLPHGHLAGGLADDTGQPVRGGGAGRRGRVAEVPLCDLARLAQHGGAGLSSSSASRRWACSCRWM